MTDALHVEGERRALRDRPGVAAVALAGTEPDRHRQRLRLRDAFARMLAAHAPARHWPWASPQRQLEERRPGAGEGARAEAGTIAFTGEGGGQCRALADVCLMVPSRRTAHPGLHILAGHTLCDLVEQALFPAGEPPRRLPRPRRHAHRGARLPDHDARHRAAAWRRRGARPPRRRGLARIVLTNQSAVARGLLRRSWGVLPGPAAQAGRRAAPSTRSTCPPAGRPRALGHPVRLPQAGRGLLDLALARPDVTSRAAPSSATRRATVPRRARRRPAPGAQRPTLATRPARTTWPTLPDAVDWLLAHPRAEHPLPTRAARRRRAAPVAAVSRQRHRPASSTACAPRALSVARQRHMPARPRSPAPSPA